MFSAPISKFFKMAGPGGRWIAFICMFFKLAFGIDMSRLHIFRELRDADETFATKSDGSLTHTLRQAKTEEPLFRLAEGVPTVESFSQRRAVM